MFDPNDPDRPVKAFLQEYQTWFGFGPEAITNATVQRDDVSAGNGARTAGFSLTTLTWSRARVTILSHSRGRGIRAGVPVFDAHERVTIPGPFTDKCSAHTRFQFRSVQKSMDKGGPIEGRWMGMTTSTTLGRKTALTAVYAERYVLSFVFLYLAWIDLHKLWAGGLGQYGTERVLLVEIARHVIYSQLQVYTGFLLLLGRRATVLPQNFKDLLVPLATTFFNLTYSAVPWLPSALQKSLCPIGLQTSFAATGLFLNFIGLMVAVWGAFHLGRSFGVFIEVRKVVFDGAYRWVRHPMYLGFICLLVGLILANFSGAYFILVPIHISLLLYRARLEEARLSEHSTEYREYLRQTGFIFPRFRHPGPFENR
jgi:protein-S-isoprenylcysteine O-methyltransferase Ste14